jgi:hypothetical protein
VVAIDQFGLADRLIESGLPDGLARDGDVSMDGDGAGENGSSEVPALEAAPLQAANRTLAPIVSMARASVIRNLHWHGEGSRTGSHDSLRAAP